MTAEPHRKLRPDANLAPMQEEEVVLLLATYNGAAHLPELVASLGEQTYPFSRLVTGDDGSTDHTPSLVEHWTRDSEFTVTVQPRRSAPLGPGLNFGGLLADALELPALGQRRYYLFCDQDDVWLPNKIEKLVAALKLAEQTHPGVPILVHSDLLVVDPQLNVIDPSFWHYQNIDPARHKLNHLLLQNTVSGCACIFNDALAQLASPVPAAATMHDWWLALVASAFGEIVPVYDSLILYRQHAANDQGAARYNLPYITKKFWSLLAGRDFDRLIGQRIAQARAFYARYRDRLSPNHCSLLEDFISIRDQGFVERRRRLARHRLAKSGMSRNLGLYLFI